MSLRPLLSLVEGGVEYDTQNKKEGLNSEQRNNFENRLYKVETIEASGVPSLFGHPFVFYTKLNAGIEDTFDKFSILIKGIFLDVISLEKVEDIGQLKDVIMRIKPYFRDFTILKWKEKPIGGCYPECLVFPGAGFEALEYGDEVSWGGLKSEIEKKEAQLGSDIVRALFREWIGEIKNILNLPVDNNGPLWFQMLFNVSNNWDSNVLPSGSALDEFTAEIYKVNVVNYDNNLINIPIRHIKDNIFCEKIVRFANGKMPDLPVKLEYLKIIQSCQCVDNKYKLTLNGWNRTIEWIPQVIIDVDKASILLWPNFKAPDWNVNYILFYPSEVLRGYNPSLRLINFDGKEISLFPEIKQEDERMAMGGRVNKAITYIEMFCDNIPCGIFLDMRGNITPASGSWRTSLDFGTVHTCLSIKDDKGIIPFVFKDMTVDILGMNFYDQDTFRMLPYWLPTFDGDFTVLPSELLFVTSEKIGDINSLSEPIKCFSIPSFQSPIPKIGEEELRIISGVKWVEPLRFKGHRKDLVKAYLKMVMHMALANLRKFKNASYITVVPTYPLAFDKDRYNNYKDWLIELFDELKNETGINVQLEVTTRGKKKELVGESYAGCYAFNPSGTVAEFIVDIGGGTTDIALLKNKGIVAVESIRYGGNIFIKSLASKLFPPFEEYRGPDIEKKVIVLNKAIRIEGIKTVFDKYSESERENAEGIMHKFFDGLFEFLCNLLTAFSLKDNIFLYPIGNGWRFIEGFKIHNTPTLYITNWFASRAIKVTIQPIQVGVKEVLAIGANHIIDTGGIDGPNLDEPIKSVIGGDVTIRWKSNGERSFKFNDSIPTEGLGCTFEDGVRLDTTKFIEKFPFGLPDGHTPQQLAGLFNTRCVEKEGNMLYLGGGGVLFVKSVFGRFLETIYPEYYL